MGKYARLWESSRWIVAPAESLTLTPRSSFAHNHSSPFTCSRPLLASGLPTHSSSLALLPP
jgi:hypothetical protein